MNSKGVKIFRTIAWDFEDSKLWITSKVIEMLFFKVNEGIRGDQFGGCEWLMKNMKNLS